MEITLDTQYIENLNAFIGKKIQVKNFDEYLEFPYDAELQYRLIEKPLSNYEFQAIERGKVFRSTEYNAISVKEMKRNLALNLKGLFGGSIDYSKADEFRAINFGDIEQLDHLMQKFIGSDYYSINEPQTWKVNLEIQENQYNLYILLRNNDKLYREKNISSKRAYSRFYNEALFLKETIKNIHLYQKIFKDKLTDDEIDRLV